MKIFILICSLIAMNQLWAMGSRGLLPAETEAMGNTTAVLNQITPEQETEPSLEEVHKQQEMDVEEARKSQEAFPDEADESDDTEQIGPISKPLH